MKTWATMRALWIVDEAWNRCEYLAVDRCKTVCSQCLDEVRVGCLISQLEDEKDYKEEYIDL